MTGFEIQYANWCLGMSARIELRTMPTVKNIVLRFGSRDGGGLRICDTGDDTFRPITQEVFIDLLNACYDSRNRGPWTWDLFVVAWEAAAEGYDKGHWSGKHEAQP